MKTYIFVSHERKGPPAHELTVTSDSPEDAIRQAKYYPYDPTYADPTDYNSLGIEQTAFAYYGLMKDIDPFDLGNGQDGYGTILIEVDDDMDRTTRVFPSN